MTIFIPKPEPIEAYRWWMNGDAPGDGVINGINTGAVVGRHSSYRTVSQDMHCSRCGIAVGKHGTILRRMPDLEHVVCPGDWLRIHRDAQKRIVGYSTVTNKVITERYIDLATVPQPLPEKPRK